MPDERKIDVYARNRIEKLDLKVKSLEKELDAAKEEIVKLRKKSPKLEFPEFLIIKDDGIHAHDYGIYGDSENETTAQFEAKEHLEDDGYIGRLALYKFSREYVR